MRSPIGRIGLSIVVAFAAVLGVYLQTREAGQFARIIAIVSLGTAALVLLARRRPLEELTRIELQRQTEADGWRLEKENVEELEGLLQLAADLGNSADIEHLQRALVDALAPLARTRDIWLTARVGGWHEIFREGVIENASTAKARRGWETFPLRVAGKAIGVLGVAQAQGPFTPRERRFMTYAASITAIALKNVQLFDAIREQSVTDALTGCATRSHGLELLGRELRRAARSGTTVSLLMIDADGFKAINDSYGHLCGDAVLRYVGGVLRSSVRATDVPCRYGGEEFLILLPETSSGGAAKLAESIRRTLAAAKVPCDASTVTVTVSCGVATTRAGEIDASALIGRADAALYEAKSAGRNRVHVDGEPRQETRPSRDPAEWLGRERRNPNRPDRRRHSGGRRRTDLVEQQQ